MELSPQEKSYVHYFTSIKGDVETMGLLVNELYKSARLNKSIDIAYVNWLKLGVALNHTALIDASFKTLPCAPAHIEEAVDYAIINKVDDKIMERLAKNIVSREYRKKHENNKETLPILEALTEKIKDIFHKKKDIKSKITEFREKTAAVPAPKKNVIPIR